MIQSNSNKFSVFELFFCSYKEQNIVADDEDKSHNG